MPSPEPTLLRAVAPWVAVVVLVVLGVLGWLAWTAPADNALHKDYEVL